MKYLFYKVDEGAKLAFVYLQTIHPNEEQLTKGTYVAIEGYEAPMADEGYYLEATYINLENMQPEHTFAKLPMSLKEMETKIIELEQQNADLAFMLMESQGGGE